MSQDVGRVLWGTDEGDYKVVFVQQTDHVVLRHHDGRGTYPCVDALHDCLQACRCVMWLCHQVKDLAAVSLKQPVRVFVNSNTDVAPFLRQEFIRIRPNREGDREAVVAGRYWQYDSTTKKNCSAFDNRLCFSSSADSNVPGSRDVVHPDKEAGAQTPHSAGTDGPQGWRTTRRT